jgi:hypothetical protein
LTALRGGFISKKPVSGLASTALLLKTRKEKKSVKLEKVLISLMWLIAEKPARGKRRNF